MSRSLSPNADLIGVPGGVAQLVTPALIIDKKPFLANIKEMQRRCTAAGLALRPHAKTHKSAKIAELQIQAGAVGICCAIPREVLALGQRGVPDILLTSPNTHEYWAREIASLARSVKIGVVIDHVSQIKMWNDAAKAHGAEIRALVDLDVGMGRTGAEGESVISLAAQIVEASNLSYGGVQAYSGRVQHIATYAERLRVYGAQLEVLRDRVADLTAAGLQPPTVTGGGTGTFEIDAASNLFTEVQGGSYIFMDVQYNAVELDQRAANAYASSLYVAASVISANHPGHVTINAGFKAFATDGPVPKFGEPGLECTYTYFGDEYGMISGEGDLPKPGQVVRMIASHCDPTVNLHDYFHLVDDGSVLEIWNVDARGAL